MTMSGGEALTHSSYRRTGAEVASVLASMVRLPSLSSYDYRAELGRGLTEIEELQQLLDSGARFFGFTTKLQPVGEDGKFGYVITLNGQELDRSRPLHLTDLDDTLIATTRAKGKLEEEFRRLLWTGKADAYEPGYSAVEGGVDYMSEIMVAANAFSRWEEDGHSIHHIDAHYAALSWAHRTFNDLRRFPAAEVARHIVGVLTRIGGQEGDMHVVAGPHFMRDKAGLLSAEPELVNEEMARVFMRLVGPEIFEDSLTVYRQEQYSGRANTGVLSYGVPWQQLIKFFKLLASDERRDADSVWRPNYVLLTKVDKGTFLQEILRDSDGDLAKDLKARSQQSVITYLEDDPRQIEAIAVKKLGIIIHILRSRQARTKTEAHSTGPHGIDIGSDVSGYPTLQAALADLAPEGNGD